MRNNVWHGGAVALAWGGHPHGVPMGASNPAQMMPQVFVKYSPSKTLNLVVFRLWGTMKVVIFILQITNLLFPLPFYTCKPLDQSHAQPGLQPGLIPAKLPNLAAIHRGLVLETAENSQKLGCNGPGTTCRSMAYSWCCCSFIS